MSDSMIDALISEGVIEISGIDSENGEFLYSFTNKLKDKYPLLYNQMQTSISREIMQLWEKGFVLMDVTVDNPLVSLTAKAFDDIEINQLDQNLQHSLKELKRITAID